MIDKVARYITSNSLLDAERPVIVALSGGADSVALLSVLTELGYNCVAAHCNFHLRGAESQRDMLHAQAIANTLGVDLCIKNFDVPARMAATGESVEMACRALRYDWFAELVESLRAQAVAVGHHLEDQAETFMLNALRGTGIAGLAGMAARRDGNIVRPLLAVSRAEIEDYLAERGLDFVTDSSNADSSFRRNHLRNLVLPLLAERFDNPARALATTAGHVADNVTLYNYAVAQLGRRFTDSRGTIDVAALAAELPRRVAATLLLEMLKPHGFNATHVRNIIDAAGSGTTVFRAAGTVAELSRGHLTVHTAQGAAADNDSVPVSLRADITHPILITVTEHHISQFAPVRNPATAYFDATICADPAAIFELRHWRRGDRMQPFGMTGTKLLSDIFAQARLTPAQKREAWLLTRNGIIIWAPGLRTSAHFSVGPRTKRFIQCTLVPQ